MQFKVSGREKTENINPRETLKKKILRREGRGVFHECIYLSCREYREKSDGKT